MCDRLTKGACLPFGAGIGKATAIRFAEEKSNLILVARRSDRLDSLKAELQQQHEVCVVVSRMHLHAEQLELRVSAMQCRLLNTSALCAGQDTHSDIGPARHIQG